MNKAVKILLSVSELAEHLDDPNWVIIDSRFDLGDKGAGKRAFETAHIPGAIFMDLDKDLAGPVTSATGRHPLPNAEVLAEKLGNLGLCATDRVVVYDAGPGAIAARAWWILRWMGIAEVYLLDGGISAWQASGLVLDNAEQAARPARAFVAQLQQDRVLRTAALTSNPGAIEDLNLLDARDAPRYRGEIEPIDAVAGHIPGARNLPFGDFVQSDGTWRPLEERTALLETVLGTDRTASWSVMCGSGVTACHLAISGIEAGFSEPRLYVGSWSEWILDPERPIVGQNPQN